MIIVIDYWGGQWYYIIVDSDYYCEVLFDC